MPLAHIAQKISQDAEARKDSLLAHAEQMRKSLEHDTRVAIEAMQDEHDALLAQTLSENETRVRTSAEQEAKLLLEKVRADALDDVAQTAITAVTKYNDNEYKALLKVLVARLPQKVSAVLLVPEKRASLTKQVLTEHGHTITETRSLESAAGFILHTDTAVFNFSIEALVAQTKEHQEVALSRMLFS